VSRTLRILLAANLTIVAVLAFVYPHLMIAPGRLIPGHARMETDCFACHTPFAGAASESCTTCHEPDDIGRLTTDGQPVLKPLVGTPFHQQLVSQDCLGCHTDHAGVRRWRTEPRFDHDLLRADAREVCESCHEAPGDSLHRRIAGGCDQCHSQSAWVPATFAHDDYFRLDRDHDAACATCHPRNDYGRYTCYGCHEHTPAGIRREHVEEGIRDFRDCVECHRSANEHDIRMPGRRKGGEGEWGGEREGGGEREHGGERDDD
jgi:hypothetical protein